MIFMEAFVAVVATIIFLVLSRKTGNVPDVIVVIFSATTKIEGPSKIKETSTKAKWSVAHGPILAFSHFPKIM